jgi:hypothetical protein
MCADKQRFQVDASRAKGSRALNVLSSMGISRCRNRIKQTQGEETAKSNQVRLSHSLLLLSQSGCWFVKVVLVHKVRHTEDIQLKKEADMTLGELPQSRKQTSRSA